MTDTGGKRAVMPITAFVKDDELHRQRGTTCNRLGKNLVNFLKNFIPDIEPGRDDD